jgi:hypothetical protein
MEVLGMDDRIVKDWWGVVKVYGEVLIWVVTMLVVLLLIGLVELLGLWRGRGGK